MKHLILLCFTAFSLYSCTEKKEGNTSVSGVLENANQQEIYLKSVGTKNVIDVDTALVNSDGSYSFSFNPTEKIGFYRIFISPKQMLNIVVKELDQIRINGDVTNFEVSAEISGSEESTNLKKLIDLQRTYYFAVDSIRQVAYQYNQNQDFNNYVATMQLQNKLQDQYKTDNKTFIDQHLGSMASLVAIEQLDPNNDLDYFIKVEEAIAPVIPGSVFLSNLNKRISKLKKTAIGATAPEIKLSNTSGEAVSLNSLRGKYVLIDFWASWCKPCLAEAPNVVLAYEKYKDVGVGFEIYGVSLDRDKGAWEQKITQYNMDWIHVSDLKFWQSQAAIAYGVNSIPATFLLDPEGKIIAKNLRGKALEEKLQEVLK